MTVLKLSSHFPPFRPPWPHCSLHSFLELWSWWITILGADKNAKCRFYFPNITHRSWGDAGWRLCSLVRKIQGKELVCPRVASACPKYSYAYQMLINTPSSLINFIYPPCAILGFLMCPSWGTPLRRGSCYTAAAQPRRWGYHSLPQHLGKSHWETSPLFPWPGVAERGPGRRRGRSPVALVGTLITEGCPRSVAFFSGGQRAWPPAAVLPWAGAVRAVPRKDLRGRSSRGAERCGAVPLHQRSPVPAELTGSNPGAPAAAPGFPHQSGGGARVRSRGQRQPRAGRLFPWPSRPGEGAAAASGHTCGAAAEEAPEVGADGSAPEGTMTVGAKVRGRFSRRGAGDDRLCILPGEEEEAAGAGGSAGAPRPAALREEEEEEEGAGCRKVRFAVLPGSYEPLRPPRAPGKRHYGRRLKKYGKVRAQRARHGRSGDPRRGDPRRGDPRHGDPRHGRGSPGLRCREGRGSESSEGLLELSLIPRVFQDQRPALRWGRGLLWTCPGRSRCCWGGGRSPTVAWIKEHKICLFQVKMTLSWSMWRVFCIAWFCVSLGVII